VWESQWHSIAEIYCLMLCPYQDWLGTSEEITLTSTPYNDNRRMNFYLLLNMHFNMHLNMHCQNGHCSQPIFSQNEKQVMFLVRI